MVRKRKSFCEYCGSRRCYNYTHDSLYCRWCDRWLENECKCSPEDNCEFQGRPALPSEAEKHSFDTVYPRSLEQQTEDADKVIEASVDFILYLIKRTNAYDKDEAYKRVMEIKALWAQRKAA
jgi:hypothetical protein